MPTLARSIISKLYSWADVGIGPYKGLFDNHSSAFHGNSVLTEELYRFGQ